MGRYTSVQAYTDNNPSMRSVPYEQATSSSTAAAASSTSAEANNSNNTRVITEKVDNPYGSTAGAGSGEFHVYRHARAREAARWKAIHESEAERKAESEFRSQLANDNLIEENKTEKRRRKRERAKEAKRRKKNMKLGGVGLDQQQQQGSNDDGEDEEEEFQYTSVVVEGNTDREKIGDERK